VLCAFLKFSDFSALRFREPHSKSVNLENLKKIAKKKLAIEKEFFYIHFHVLRSTLARNLLLALADMNAATGHFIVSRILSIINALNRTGRRSPTFLKLLRKKSGYHRRVGLAPVSLFSDLAARAFTPSIFNLCFIRQLDACSGVGFFFQS
jgi:hypothetical protein